MFEIPQFEEEKTAAWLEEMEEKVKQEAISALGTEGSVKNVIVEEREVPTSLFFFLPICA